MTWLHLAISYFKVVLENFLLQVDDIYIFLVRCFMVPQTTTTQPTKPQWKLLKYGFQCSWEANKYGHSFISSILQTEPQAFLFMRNYYVWKKADCNNAGLKGILHRKELIFRDFSPRQLHRRLPVVCSLNNLNSTAHIFCITNSDNWQLPVFLVSDWSSWR